ncbi:putative catechol O-methyltransferase 1 [Diplonema papillatum]|nr:putative catechol O-methyltransferase 1 [Diplonema papillatum]
MSNGSPKAALQHVRENAQQGDAKSVVDAIDKYCWGGQWLMNVGDEKGQILDAALREAVAKHAEARPFTVLELGTFIGYSSTRMSLSLRPNDRIITVDVDEDRMAVARAVHAFAGKDKQISCVKGPIDSSGSFLRSLEASHGLGPGSVDFVFIDHVKDLYLTDLQHILAQKLLRKGSVVVGDNIIYPGAPDYRVFVNSSPLFKTVEHETHLEYSTDRDLVTVSEFLGQ